MRANKRFVLMTWDLKQLDAIRAAGELDGYAVDLYPHDAPPPAADSADGAIADLRAGGRYALARELFLKKLARIAKALPVVAFDRGLTPTEAGLLRAAGIRWLPALDARAFGLLTTHPLATAPAPSTDIEVLAEVS